MWYKPIGSCIVQRKHTSSHPTALESILRVPNFQIVIMVGYRFSHISISQLASPENGKMTKQENCNYAINRVNVVAKN